MEDYVTKELCAASCEKILAKLQALDDKLYRDNGGKSIQSRLNYHAAAIKSMLWIISIIAVAMIGSIVKLLFFGGVK